MPSESVLLIHSEEPGWIAVRTALRTMATVDAIQEALDPSTAREL